MPYGKTRHSTQYVKEQNKSKKINVCELGVSKGYNARNLLSVLNIDMLYLVDTYKPFTYLGKTNTDYVDGRAVAERRLRRFGNVKFFFEDCVVAAKLVPDGLDFIYYDAAPDYDTVMSVLSAWFPKLRAGGVIGGRGVTFATVCEIRAVLAFVDKHKGKCIEDGRANEWWIKKIIK